MACERHKAQGLRQSCSSGASPEAAEAEGRCVIQGTAGKTASGEAKAQAIGLRAPKAIGDAVPVRLMKGDLLFVVERLARTLDDRRVASGALRYGVGEPKDGESLPKLVSALVRKADEGALGRLLIEFVILQTTPSQT